MEQIAKESYGKAGYKSLLVNGYRVIKKLVKYTTYCVLIYFAWRGFMAWK